MTTKKISLDLPIGMFEKIMQITKNDAVYEDHHDLIVHAITDLLEAYHKK